MNWLMVTRPRLADNFLKYFALICSTSLSLRFKSNKTVAKLLTSELTILQIDDICLKLGSYLNGKNPAKEANLFSLISE